MHSLFRLNGLKLAGLLGLMLAALSPTSAAAKPDPSVKPRGFRLFARVTDEIKVNRVDCFITNTGQICTSSASSSTAAGGFWPRGTIDQYVFNSGLQLGGVIDTAGGKAQNSWAGDTTGAFFFDGRGDLNHGQSITPIFNSNDPNDAAFMGDPTCNTPHKDGFSRNLCLAGQVPKAGVGGLGGDANGNTYDPLLQGRAAASQGDVWWLQSDLNLSFTNGRAHPLGLVVEQRGMGWNFPSGNEDILYFVYTFYNATSKLPASYTSVRSGMQDVLLSEGIKFQAAAAAQGVVLPDSGYKILNMFTAFAADMDVGAGGSDNYASVNIPFAMGYAYRKNFPQLTGYDFPGAVFGNPFFKGIGFVGVKYLKGPLGSGAAGLTLFTANTNGSTFPDPLNVTQLYRYLTGKLLAGVDVGQCSYPNPLLAKICYIKTDQGSDVRFQESAGPITLAPGQFQSIVVAYVFAAPVATGTATTGACPNTTGCDIKPGNTNIIVGLGSRDTLLKYGGANPIDSITGWNGFNSPDSVVDQTEVSVIKGSLLDKGLVAQAVFDHGFLLPFAPDAPNFYLIPGNNQVTVLWQPTASEVGGDPFFQLAQQVTVIDPTTGLVIPNALYDPNYRQFDVEGYRIYRGRTDLPNQLQLLQQFDYGNTTISDFAGQVNPDAKCAPEIGVRAPAAFDTLGTVVSVCGAGVGTSTPVPYDSVGPGLPRTVHVDVPLVGDIVQVKLGQRSALLGGQLAIILQADTAVSGGKTGFPQLSDNGVPFTFVDKGVRNSFNYFYSVTSFDINSFQSGPGTLESPRLTKAVVPTEAATNVDEAALVSSIQGDDGVALDPTQPWKIDSKTGKFTGPPPPTDAISGTFAPLVPQLLPALTLSASVDSLKAHSDADFPCGANANGLDVCHEVFLTFDKNGTQTHFVVVVDNVIDQLFDGALSSTVALGAQQVAADSASVARYNVPVGFSSFNAAVGATLRQYIDNSAEEGQRTRRNDAVSGGFAFCGNATGFCEGGSRWFSGIDETTDHPTIGIRVGHLTGVDSVWAPIHHVDTDPTTPGVQPYGNRTLMQCFSYLMSGLSREADVQLTWGVNGAITSVRDVTHHVPITYKPVPEGGTYGFIGDANGDGVVSWDDFQYMETVSQFADDNAGIGIGFCVHTDPGAGNRAQLAGAPTLTPISTDNAQVNPPVTGQGFGLYIDGERFIFQITKGAAPATFPAAGTVWTLRTYAGQVKVASGSGTLTPNGYSFTAVPRPPLIPGLKVVFNVPKATSTRTVTAADVSKVHTVPDPYYVTSSFEATTDNKIIKFVNLPDLCFIRIYSSSGVLVTLLEHRATSFGGEENWNVRNRNNQVVASGVYFYSIETPQGVRKIGRMTVVNFAQ